MFHFDEQAVLSVAAQIIPKLMQLLKVQKPEITVRAVIILIPMRFTQRRHRPTRRFR